MVEVNIMNDIKKNLEELQWKLGFLKEDIQMDRLKTKEDLIESIEDIQNKAIEIYKDIIKNNNGV